MVARPLREDEYDAWRAHSLEEYASDMVRSGMSEQEAREQAAHDVGQLLVDGLRTPGHRILVLEDEVTGERVGTLWFAEQERSGRKSVYLYEIEIDERQRGRGLGREAMLLIERMATDLGAEHVDLAVFGGNDRALALYESLGYGVTVRLMRKRLGGDAPA